MELFALRLGTETLPQRQERTVCLPLLGLPHGQLAQGSEVLLREPLPLVQHPIVVVARQELPAIAIDRLLQVPVPLRRCASVFCAGERGFELRDIGDHRLRIEPDDGAVGDQDAARGGPRWLQLAAQHRESNPETPAAVVQFRLGPEEIHHPLAGMRPIAVAGQVSEEQSRAAAVEAGGGVRRV